MHNVRKVIAMAAFLPAFNKLFLLLTCSLFFTLLLCHTATANAATQNSDTWQFHIAPYAWLAGQNGTVATLPGLPPADIDIDFWDDIAGNINGGLFLLGEAQKGRWGLLMDIAYVDIEIDEEGGQLAPLFSSVTSGTESWIVSAAGFYRAVERDRSFLDLFAGARYWSVDSTLELGAGLLPARKVSNKEDWFDPIVGLKGLSYLGQSKFFISGGAAIGGFGAGSDFMWDVQAHLGYRWTRTFSTTLGYRYLDVDYQKDDFLYDVAQHGPVLGLSWRF